MGQFLHIELSFFYLKYSISRVKIKGRKTRTDLYDG